MRPYAVYKRDQMLMIWNGLHKLIKLRHQRLVSAPFLKINMSVSNRTILTANICSYVLYVSMDVNQTIHQGAVHSLCQQQHLHFPQLMFNSRPTSSQMFWRVCWSQSPCLKVLINLIYLSTKLQPFFKCKSLDEMNTVRTEGSEQIYI